MFSRIILMLNTVGTHFKAQVWGNRAYALTSEANFRTGMSSVIREIYLESNLRKLVNFIVAYIAIGSAYLMIYRRLYHEWPMSFQLLTTILI